MACVVAIRYAVGMEQEMLDQINQAIEDIRRMAQELAAAVGDALMPQPKPVPVPVRVPVDGERRQRSL